MEADEAYRPIKFFDVGAFVWFARIIEWEFPNFSVDNCFEKLLEIQKKIDNGGCIEGTPPLFINYKKIIISGNFHPVSDSRKYPFG